MQTDQISDEIQMNNQIPCNFQDTVENTFEDESIITNEKNENTINVTELESHADDSILFMISDTSSRIDEDKFDSLIPSFHSSETSNLKVMHLTAENESEKPNLDFANILISMPAFFENIPRYQSLSSQNFACFFCKSPLTNFQHSFYCHYSGYIGCLSCLAPTKTKIPSKVIHNLDFAHYTVSSVALKTIDSMKRNHICEIYNLNPHLYTICPKLQTIRNLRECLSLLKQLLTHCSTPNSVYNFLKDLGEEHYCNNTDSYTFDNFLKALDGCLMVRFANILKKYYNHTYSCTTCCNFGVRCSICQHEKRIFLFQGKNYLYQCQSCHTLFHKECVISRKSCPTCSEPINHG